MIYIAGINGPSPRLEAIFRRLNVERDRFAFTGNYRSERVVGEYDGPVKCGWINTEYPLGEDRTVVLAFGDEALKAYVGVRGMKSNHGYVHHTDAGPVIATFHPQFLVEGNAKLTPAVEMAISKAILLDQHLYAEDVLDLRLNPSAAEVSKLLHSQKSLMVDIETPYADDDEEPENDPSYTIERVGVSWAPGKALSVPWTPPYTEILRHAFSLSRELQFWNKYFDWPRLKASGVKSEARIVDAQEAWHFLQSDMPKALGFVAPFFVNTASWKHMGADKPEFYNVKDTATQSLIYARTRRALEQRGSLGAFDRHCIEAGQLLSRMGFIGVDASRQATFMDGLRESLRESDDQLQTFIPEECKPVKVYKRKASVILPFNPNSPLQVTNLCKHLKIALPKGTGAKYLRKTKNRILRKVLECREQGKFLSTYQYKIGTDGLVRTTYTFKPSTWRKASQDPNLQNIPSRSALASKFKEMFVARPGFTLLEADSSAIEAVIVGYCAESPDYIRLAKAGVHGWLCAALAREPISLELPDEELKRACSSFKHKDKALYDKCKRVVHLSNYMGTAYRMAEEYPDDFPTVKAAKTLQDFYFNTKPGKAVQKWHQSAIARADAEKFLDNHWRYRHYFYNLKAYNAMYGTWGYGVDARRAVAYVPQSDASAIQTEILLSLPEWLKPALRLVVHDSILLEVPTAELKRYASALYEKMTQPWPELGGLAIGAEVKAGENWGEMEALKL